MRNVLLFGRAATLLALTLVGSWPAVGQQPTLRYSSQAARKATPREHEAHYAEAAEHPDVVGTGVPGGVRQVAHQGPLPAGTRMPPGYRPSYHRTGERVFSGSPEIIDTPIAGEVTFHGGEEIHLPPHAHMPGSDCATCGPGGYGRVYGGDPACGTCGPCFPRLSLENLELFAGAHGFTGPNNRGSGSFGFHEGLNLGTPFICGLALQGGYQATQSNFEGTFFTPDDRTQSFVTVGAFRRVDLGLQGGVVVDYLGDKWDCDINLAQLRGELSWKMPCEHEFGFWFAAGLDRSSIVARDVQFPLPGGEEDTVEITDGTFTVEPLDIYAFFYRKQLACGGECRAWAGFTDESQGLMGGNLSLPVSNCLSFATDFLYIMPREASTTSFTDEAWNVSFSFVWTPCRRNVCGPNYCRPLFDVANNGSFVVKMR